MISPDPALKQFAEFKEKTMNDLVLLHEDDIHFNLVVSKESDLVKYGSLSYRFNIGPIMDEIDEEKTSSKDDSEILPGENAMVDVKKQLKECQKTKKMVENEYSKCAKELNLKTEECEKLKIVIKDLKQILDLKEKTEDVIDEDEPVIETDNSGGNEVPWITRNKSNQFRYRKSVLANGKVEKEYNCNECDYQGTTDTELTKHVELKHTNGNQVKCRICGESFDTKWEFMNHRKAKHITRVAQCKNYIAEKCNFSALKCWWKHEERQENCEERFDCFLCNETFKSKMELMTHRKKKHLNMIRQCQQFYQNSCRYTEESCWFKHETEERDTDKQGGGNEKLINSDSVFREVPANKKPPISRNRMTQNL